jgi:hypothetical protein
MSAAAEADRWHMRGLTVVRSTEGRKMPFSHLPAPALAETQRTDGAGESVLAILAVERRADLLREVAASRIARQAHRATQSAPQPDAAWRYRAGRFVIRFGGWVQGGPTFAPMSAERRDTYA